MSTSDLTPPGSRQRNHAANRLGILFMVVSLACFVINDALMKALGASMPLWQAIFVRAVFSSIWIVIALQVTGVRVKPLEHARPPVIVRGLLDCLATFTYLLSLMHMPLGDAIAINMASPLMVTTLAVLVLRERVDRLRWMAILVGFGGVLLLVQPSAEGRNFYALLCLFATLMHSIRDLVTRRIAQGVPSLVITLATSLTIMVVSGLFCLGTNWQPLDLRSTLLLAAAALFLTGGYFFVIRSTRIGELSVVAPFRYSGLPIALVLGWAVWGDLPNLTGWTGIALLVGAGLYLLHREREARR
jgi:drug/metabolite transporter (DMT)-like permease